MTLRLCVPAIMTQKGQTLLCLNLSLVYSLTVGKVTNYFLTLYA